MSKLGRVSAVASGAELRVELSVVPGKQKTLGICIEGTLLPP